MPRHVYARPSANPPQADKRSLVHTYVIPEQDYKLKSGDSVTVVHIGEQINNVVVNQKANRISFRRTAYKEPLPHPLFLGAGGHINPGILTAPDLNVRFLQI